MMVEQAKSKTSNTKSKTLKRINNLFIHFCHNQLLCSNNINTTDLAQLVNEPKQKIRFCL